jgi:hypothetical protein
MMVGHVGHHASLVLLQGIFRRAPLCNFTFFIVDTNQRRGKKTQVKNDSAELFFSFHFWVGF